MIKKEASRLGVTITDKLNDDDEKSGTNGR